MKTNTLVTHKEHPEWGIGCISKVLISTYRVNFGTEDVKTARPHLLQEVDVSGVKTIDVHAYNSTIMNADTKHPYVILGNELRHYVGIGWITHRVITMDDLKRYPRVV